MPERFLLAPLAAALIAAGGLPGCIDLEAMSPFPCGADGTCPASFECVGGKCHSTSCQTTADCTAFPGRYCRSGLCVPCTETLCGLECVDLTSSRSHCGRCGAACRSDQVCSASTCTCPQGSLSCALGCSACQAGSVASCLSSGEWACCAETHPVLCESSEPALSGCWGSAITCSHFTQCAEGWFHCPAAGADQCASAATTCQLVLQCPDGSIGLCGTGESFDSCYSWKCSS
ncbi:MAG: hypothetical protein HY901_31680 [Deltaproteobacteria bacterium]|nr:hypothetical protein [Deltaproteobacteria bacterium]